jgi:fructuronate reductase/mannitol 2-dehydrogenase
MTGIARARVAARRRLSEATLAGHAGGAALPGYDRSRLAPAVVHIGLGAFHRAHQAAYFDELARSGAGAWGITGVSLRRPAVPRALAAQDGLYTLLARDAEGESCRVVGSLRGTLYAPDDPGRVLATLADTRTQLVTLTVTGDAYAAAAADPGRRDSAFGYIVEALARRRAAGAGPFTVLSCDNIADNGAATRAAVLAHAGLRDDVLARWIERHAAFPASMVDRITPCATPADAERAAARLGLADRSPVVTEAFTQWVIEDAFAGVRPPLEEVGVAFVSQVAPYRLAKTRLLNGAHCALGYLGTLAGHRTTAGAMADPRIRAYVTRLMHEEIAPLLPGLPGLDVTAYCRALLRRLANPAIADPLTRLCARGSTKMPAYLLPSLAEALAGERPHAALALAVAAWLRCLRGTDLAGAPIEILDDRADRLCALAALGGDDPRPVLSERDVFGDLGSRPGFAAAVEEALRDLAQRGPAALDGPSGTDLALAA